MYDVTAFFICLGTREGTNEVLRKIVPDYQAAALEFLQSISARINGDRVLAGVEIKYKGVG